MRSLFVYGIIIAHSHLLVKSFCESFSRFSAIFSPPSFFARSLRCSARRFAHFPGNGGGIPPEGEAGARFGGGGGS